MRRVVSLLSVPLLTAVTIVAAQQTLDRTKIPDPGPTPTLHVPTWTKTTLSNGATLIVSEKHDLPLVSFSITFQGGADQFETSAKRGAASLTASMMMEGTTTRDGEALSNALQLLGASIGVGIGGENGSITFTSTAAKFEPTLAILADVLMHPTFPDASLERQRTQRLVALTQGKAQPATIASRVFPRVLYGIDHPYGQSSTEESLKAIAREDLIALHKSYFTPGHALVTVVGDVSPPTVKAAVDRALTAWTGTSTAVSFTYPPTPAPKPTTIYLVDKPGAAQSTFTIGLPGPTRATPDYYALQVMNTMLGGYFQSRLNMNLREEKGYSYGVNSGFAFGKGPGPFRAGGDIVSAKSDAALIEFMKELRGIQGSRPITDDELKMAKDSLIQRLPGTFASVGAINNAITTIWTQGLPEDYYQQYGQKVAAITRDDVLRVAKQYVDLEHLAIVIVGDRASIEAPLRATGIAPITVLDIEGKAIPNP
jgi:zinc protease